MTPLMFKFIGVWYIFFSITLFAIYGIDKAQAQINGRRIPEKWFHYLALAGGFFGGLIGRPFFHHKTRKPIFLIILLLSLVVHVITWGIIIAVS